MQLARCGRDAGPVAEGLVASLECHRAHGAWSLPGPLPTPRSGRASLPGISQQPHEDGWPASLSACPSPGASASDDGGTSRFAYPIGRATKTQNPTEIPTLVALYEGPISCSRYGPCLAYRERQSRRRVLEDVPGYCARTKYRSRVYLYSVLTSDWAWMLGPWQEVVPTLQHHHNWEEPNSWDI